MIFDLRAQLFNARANVVTGGTHRELETTDFAAADAGRIRQPEHADGS
jgi:hypothetical protein